MYMKLIAMSFIPIFFLGCGVNEDVHKKTLNELQAKKAELKKALSETADANKEIAALQKIMQEKEQENRELSASVSEKEQSIKDLSAKMAAALDAKKTELDKALSETADANKEFAALQKTMQEKEQEISQLSASVSVKEQNINDLSDKMAAALDAKKTELDKALSETAEVNKKIAGLQKTLQEKEQENSKLSASVSVKEQKINDLSAERLAALDTKNAELDRALSETAEVNKKIAILQKTLQEKEQENSEFSASISVKEQRIEELVAEMFAALETKNAALGKALSQTADANEKIDALQKTVQEKEQELVEVSAEMLATFDAKKAEISATLHAEKVELDKALSQKAEANKKIAALQMTMQGKEQKIKVLSSGLSEKIQWFDELYEKVSEKNARINELSASVSTKEERIAELSKRVSAKDAQNYQLSETVSAKKQLIEELSAEMSAALDTKNAELDKTFSEKVEAKKKITALQKTMQEKEQLNKVLSSGLSEKVQWISDISAEKEKELVDFKNTYENLVKTLKDEVKRGEIKISRAMDSLLVKIVDKILFASGSTTIKKSGKEVLQKIGDVLETVKNQQIMIKGHTDNVPIGKTIKEEFPSNWELSAMRAINVVHYLHEKVGISPKTLSATGYSKFKPVATNDTREGRAQNRRIEIALLPLDADKVLKDLSK